VLPREPCPVWRRIARSSQVESLSAPRLSSFSLGLSPNGHLFIADLFISPQVYLYVII
jgi:hypothetical protein